jgi:uncharacterized phage protein gp47/JayE
MAYGLLSTGFVLPTLNELIEEQYAAMRAAYGENVDLVAESPLGQLSVINAEREFTIWQGLQAVYRSADPDAASGASLDNVCAVTGTLREAEAPSTVTATLTGTPTSVVPAGCVASVTGTESRFATLADVTIAAATVWAAATFTLAARRTRGGNIYEVTTAGTSVSGPSGTGTGITDGGTAVWAYLGAGTGYVDAEMESEEAGAVIGQARTLTVIETPVSGWAGVVNTLDADLGSAEELDPPLRLRREDELRAPANAAIEAIRAKVLQVDDVSQVTVFENYTDTTDGDGIPPHSIEVLVVDGDDDAIREAIFASAAGGIRTYGTETGTVTDSEGESHTIEFTRPTELDIWVIANLVVDPTEYPIDGDDQVSLALVTAGDAQRTGKNVVASAQEAICHSIPGVLEAECLIKTSNPPTVRTTIAVTMRQIAKFDSSRITVNTTPGVP